MISSNKWSDVTFMCFDRDICIPIPRPTYICLQQRIKNSNTKMRFFSWTFVGFGKCEAKTTEMKKKMPSKHNAEIPCISNIKYV